MRRTSLSSMNQATKFREEPSVSSPRTIQPSCKDGLNCFLHSANYFTRRRRDMPSMAIANMPKEVGSGTLTKLLSWTD